MTEEQIRAATIGELEPHAATIQLAEYDPEWPLLFEREAVRIREALDARALVVEHVGSTSVPGLAAKPVIDIVLVVDDSADESAYVADLEACGYVLRMREPDWFEHRLLKRPATDVNLHVFSRGCAEVQVMIDFRDLLRENEVDRELYESAKRELGSRTWRYVQDYADAKSAVVAEINARAQRR